jgi:hypothetical protein
MRPAAQIASIMRQKIMPRRHCTRDERIQSISLFFTLLTFLLSSTLPLSAQENSDAAPKPAKLFSSSDTLNVTMTAPWRDIVRNVKNQNPYPAKIEFTDELGNTMSLDMTAQRRGLTRQRVCSFPPIKLRFEKETVKGTTFRGQKSVKMVTHCEKAPRFQQYYILEMLAYRMYNLITDYSFRVRPLTVNYVDSKTGKTDESRFAFLIEDDSDVAKRNGLKKLRLPKVKVTQLKPGLTSEFSLFQYMIANVDWAALSGRDPNKCCHNVKLIGPEPLQAKDLIYPIPYDFDSAGMVDAHYAAPPNGLPIRSVTQRLFRGYCIHNDTLEDARKHILTQQAAIIALVNDADGLPSGVKNRTAKYIGKFFKTISDPDHFQKQIIQRCRN